VPALCGFPCPRYAQTYGASFAFHGSLVTALGQHVADPTGTGIWSGMEFPVIQQPPPAICTLLETEESGVPASIEVWWSTTTPTLHIRSDFDLIPHRYRINADGTVGSIPVQAVWLDVTSIGPAALSGTWYTVGAGSMSGNSSSGTWTANRQ
jgi:hypothetical protein